MYVRGLLQGAAKAGSEPIAMHAFNACMAMGSEPALAAHCSTPLTYIQHLNTTGWLPPQ